MKCQHCNIDFEEDDIHEHHIHPRFMNNKKGEGMKIHLCKKCHDILHFIIPKLMWDVIPNIYKPALIEKIKYYSLQWGNQKEDDGLLRR